MNWKNVFKKRLLVREKFFHYFFFPKKPYVFSLLISIGLSVCFLTIYTIAGDAVRTLQGRCIKRVDWRCTRVELGRIINTIILQNKNNFPFLKLFPRDPLTL